MQGASTVAAWPTIEGQRDRRHAVLPNFDCADYWLARDVDNVNMLLQIPGYTIAAFCVKNKEAFIAKFGGRHGTKFLPVERSTQKWSVDSTSK